MFHKGMKLNRKLMFVGTLYKAKFYKDIMVLSLQKSVKNNFRHIWLLENYILYHFYKECLLGYL